MLGANILAGGFGWLDAAFLIGLFWAVLVHPDRIRSLLEFRIAVVFFAFSIVTPVIIAIILLPSTGGRGQDPGWLVYSSAATPVLKMFAVLIGLNSVSPRSNSSRHRVVTPETEPSGPFG